MSRTLSNKSDEKDKTAIKKNSKNSALSSDDLIHQKNEGLSSDVVQNNAKRRNVVNIIDKLHFQSKVIKFTNYFMYNYNLIMLRGVNLATNTS